MEGPATLDKLAQRGSTSWEVAGKRVERVKETKAAERLSCFGATIAELKVRNTSRFRKQKGGSIWGCVANSAAHRVASGDAIRVGTIPRGGGWQRQLGRNDIGYKVGLGWRNGSTGGGRE